MKILWHSFINGVDIIIQLRQVPALGSFKPVAATQFVLDRYELRVAKDKATLIRRIKSDMTKELKRFVKAI